MRLVSYLIILGALSVILCNVQKKGSVYQLKDDSFEQFVKENAAVFVKIYSPDCGHCKQLAPEFTKAAEIMEEQGVMFGELDATVETETGEKLEIEGFPTVLFFFNGKKIEYDSERTAEDIVDWIQRKMMPTIQKISTAEELNELYNNTNTSVVIMYLGEGEGELYGIFNVLSNEIDQQGLFFVESQAEELIQQYQPKNKIVILKKFDEERVDLEEGADEAKIEQFIKWNRVPAVMDLGMSYADIIFSQPIPCLFLFLNSNQTDENEVFIKELHEASKVMKNKIFIAIAKDNEEISSKMMEFLVILPDTLPRVFIVEPKDESVFKYKFPHETINSATIIEFFESYSKGELKPFYQSEDIPEQDYLENVRQIVAKNFREVLATAKDNQQYVLVKFYANWCPHCQRLKNKYIKLATKLKEVNQKIILAEVEATLNEIEEQVIEGVPTLLLFKPQEESVEYTGKLNLKDIIAFLQQEMKEHWVEAEVELETEEELKEMEMENQEDEGTEDEGEEGDDDYEGDEDDEDFEGLEDEEGEEYEDDDDEDLIEDDDQDEGDEEEEGEQQTHEKSDL